MEFKGKASLKHGTLDYHFTWGLPEIVGLCGKNGIGKSSFFSYLKEQADKKFEKETSFLDQFPLETLGELSLDHFFHDIQQLMPGELDSSFFQLLCQKLGCQELRGKSINSLSGGENQLVKLAMTFIKPSSYFFLDEPFNYLDEFNQKRVELFLRDQKEVSFFIIDHNLARLKRLAKRVYQVHDLNNHAFQLEEVHD